MVVCMQTGFINLCFYLQGYNNVVSVLDIKSLN